MYLEFILKVDYLLTFKNCCEQFKNNNRINIGLDIYSS